MAFEVPFSLIRGLQADLRRELGLSSFDPGAPSIPPPLLPIGEAAEWLVAPSGQPKLCCQACRAALLRGPQSVICIFCGAEQRREGAPLAIRFGSTVACGRFLASLGLDGSEPLYSEDETNQSNKDPDASKNGQVLLNRLELELSWPSNAHETDVASKERPISHSAPALNLSGIDLDTFFLEKGKEASATPGSSNEPLVFEKQDMGSEIHLFPRLEVSAVAANFQSSDTMAVLSVSQDQVSESSAAWEAEFQSAASEHPPLFAPSESENVLQDSTFQLGQQHETSTNKDRKHERGANLMSSDMVREETGLFDQVKDFSGSYASSSNLDYNISVDDSSVQADPWLTSYKNEPHNSHEDGDMFDIWQGFAETGGKSGGIPTTGLQPFQLNAVSAEDTEFGDFLHSVNDPQSFGNNASNLIDGKNVSNQENIINGNDVFYDWKGFSTSHGVSDGVLESNPQALAEGPPNYEHSLQVKLYELQNMVYGDLFNSVSPAATDGHLLGRNKEEPANKNSANEDDLFDDWNAFMTSGEARAGQSNLQVQTDGRMLAHEPSSATNNLVLEDSEFLDFLHSQCQSGPMIDNGRSNKANDVHLSTSASGRMDQPEAGGDAAHATLPEETLCIGLSRGSLQDPNSILRVDALLSQLHDLSFMLGDELTIPAKDMAGMDTPGTNSS